MKAVVCHETNLVVEELPEPVPGPGQVLLEVVRGGICGSDLHARRHADELADLAAGIGYVDVMRPHQSVVMGHEFSGRVLDYGPSTRKAWSTGTPVVSLPMIQMGDRVQMTGLSAKAPGAYAERAARPGVPHHGRAQRSRPGDRSPHRAAGGRLARRTPERGAQEGDRRRDRLRSDRAGRDPDAQGARGADRDRQRLLTWSSRAGGAVRCRRGRRPGGGLAVEQLRGEQLHHRRQRPLRPRARHDGQAAQGAEAAMGQGAARCGGCRRDPQRSGGLRVRRRSGDHRPGDQCRAPGDARRGGRGVHGAGHDPAGDGDQQGDRAAVRLRLPAARVPRGAAPDRRAGRSTRRRSSPGRSASTVSPTRSRSSATPRSTPRS